MKNIKAGEDFNEENNAILNLIMADGYSESAARHFLKIHPEFIGCENDPELLAKLNDALDEDMDDFNSCVGQQVSFHEIEQYPKNYTILNSDLQGLSENEIENLEFSGIAKQIVNKWLCQALDRNDSKAVMEYCIVLKAMKKDAN